MSGYLKDVLLALSVIAAPIILGTLLYYGLTISDRRHHETSDDQKKDEMRRESKAPSEHGDDAKTNSA